MSDTAIDRDGRQFRLLTIHGAVWSFAMSLASGFVGAYLLRQGFGIATTVAMYGALLAIRFSLRFVMLPIIRRLGMRKAALLGASIAAFQFLPLIHATEPRWLVAWILIVSAGECVYWPIIHAANAVCGGDGYRGRQLASRQMASTAISVVGPVIGGLLLTRIGPVAEFGIATAVCLLSMAPLLAMRELQLGVTPTVRGSWRGADTIGMCVFAADGWMCAGVGFAWPIILFSTLGSSYAALGWAASAAGVAGAAAGMLGGIAIDRGHRARLSGAVMIALLIGVALRVASGWAPWLAVTANTAGAAVGGIYYTVIMSVVYDRAKRSGSAYQFHLSAEAGWDAGAILGCMITAAVASSGLPVTISVLPAAFGVVMIHRCVRAEAKAVAAVHSVVPAGQQTAGRFPAGQAPVGQVPVGQAPAGQAAMAHAA